MENKKTLALVMVVKNEEKGLEQAILSAKPFVNEIVIAIDNFSSDKTLEIALKYADQVIKFDWQNDFSWARNLAHAGVKSEYILFLDGHEYLEKAEKLQDYLKLGCDGFLCTVRMENGIEFRNPRIYKNGVQFEGRVHERLQCKNTALCTGVVIVHNRIEGQSAPAIAERDQQRDSQMSSIMLDQIKENPKDLRSLFHLALWYQTKNNYRKALKYQNLYLKYSKSPADRYFVLFNRSLLFMGRNKLFWAFWAISRAGWEEPNRWETEKMKGIIFFSRGEYEKALPHFVNSFNENAEDFAYKPMKRNNSQTWNLIGECYYNRGIFDKAGIAFGTASDTASNKNEREFFKKRQQIMVHMLLGRKN